MILLGVDEGDEFLEQLKDALEERFSQESSKYEVRRHSIMRKRFDDGEARFKIDNGPNNQSPENILKEARKIVYVVRGSYGDQWMPFEMLGQTMFVLDKLSEYDIPREKICVVIPCQPFAKQDQSFRHGEAVSLRSYRNLVEKHASLLLNVSVHDHREDGWVDADIYSVDVARLVLEHLEGLNLENPLIILPDGAKGLGTYLGDGLKADTIILNKDRNRETGALEFKFPRYMTPKILRTYKEAVFGDDIINTGRTLRFANQPAFDAGLRIINEGIHGILAYTRIHDEPGKPDPLRPYIEELMKKYDSQGFADLPAEEQYRIRRIRDELQLRKRIPSLEMLGSVAEVYTSNTVNSPTSSYSVIDPLADKLAEHLDGSL